MKLPSVIFQKVEKNYIKFSTFFLFYPSTLNIICFIEKKIFWGSVCVLLRVTLLKVIVLSRFFGNDKIFKDLIQTVGLPVTSFTVSGRKSS